MNSSKVLQVLHLNTRKRGEGGNEREGGGAGGEEKQCLDNIFESNKKWVSAIICFITKAFPHFFLSNMKIVLYM